MGKKTGQIRDVGAVLEDEDFVFVVELGDYADNVVRQGCQTEKDDHQTKNQRDSPFLPDQTVFLVNQMAKLQNADKLVGKHGDLLVPCVDWSLHQQWPREDTACLPGMSSFYVDFSRTCWAMDVKRLWARCRRKAKI